MAKHNATGLLGENLAEQWFRTKGFTILHRNWRHGHWEIDLICHREAILHIVEVKCRRSKKFGLPEESVSAKKIKNLIDASAEYLYLYPEWKRIQFDVLSISLHGEAPPEYFYIEDVYL